MKNMDPAKLELIRMAAERTSGKSGRDLAPVMLALITSANKQGIQFSPDEVSLILEIIKKGGCFVSYKSADSDEEIKMSEKALDILGGKIEKIDKFTLPGSDMGRALVMIEKVKNTPRKYPRKAGVPSKEPL